MINITPDTHKIDGLYDMQSIFIPFSFLNHEILEIENVLI